MEIVVVGVLIFLLGKWIYDKLTWNHHAFTSEEIDAMNREMVGKSQRECKNIVKKYSNK